MKRCERVRGTGHAVEGRTRLHMFGGRQGLLQPLLVQARNEGQQPGSCLSTNAVLITPLSCAPAVSLTTTWDTRMTEA